MGRAAVVVLALANLGYFAWSAGALTAFDLMPADRAADEPQRLARQIRPERLRIVTHEQEQEEARARAEARAVTPPREPDTAATPVPATTATTQEPPVQPPEAARPPASSP
jgi:hypothetical protein